jgi:hypothetical protein
MRGRERIGLRRSVRAAFEAASTGTGGQVTGIEPLVAAVIGIWWWIVGAPIESHS